MRAPRAGPQGRVAASWPSPIDGLLRWFGLRRDSSSPAETVLVYVALLVAAFNVVVTFSDIRTYGGTDLRARVVGARAMVLGLNPYRPIPAEMRHEWLFDPHGMFREVSRCPYAPPLLAVYALLCWLPYTAQRLAWFAIEWTALLLSIAWLARMIRAPAARRWFVVLGLSFFAGGAFWRLHVERGQYYALLLALWVWAVAEARRPGKRDPWRMGVPLGVAAALRPTMIVVALPLWLLGFRRAALATVGTAAGIVLLLLPWTGLGLWWEYVRLVDIFERAIPALPALGALPAAVWVEHADFTRILDSRSANANIHLLLVTLGARFGWPAASLLPRVARTAFVVTILVLCAMLVRGRRRRRWGSAGALVAAQAVAMTTDHFLPVRWGYADVLYLAPLAVLMPTMLRERGRVLLLVVTGALVFGHSAFEPLDAGAGSLVRAVLLTGGLVGWTVSTRRAESRR